MCLTKRRRREGRGGRRAPLANFFGAASRLDSAKPRPGRNLCRRARWIFSQLHQERRRSLLRSLCARGRGLLQSCRAERRSTKRHALPWSAALQFGANQSEHHADRELGAPRRPREGGPFSLTPTLSQRERAGCGRTATSLNARRNTSAERRAPARRGRQFSDVCQFPRLGM